MRALLILTLFVGWACAFGEPGLYERLFYYYAYVLDAKVNPATGPKKIAARCALTMGKGANGVCSFNDFNKYLYAGTNGLEDAKDGWQVTNDEFPDPEKIAETQGRHGLGSPYRCDRIIPGIGQNDVRRLIYDVSTIVDGNIDKLSDGPTKNTIKSNMFKSITAVARSRMAAQVKILADAASTTGLDLKDSNGNTRKLVFELKTKEVPLFSGAAEGNTGLRPDIAETARAAGPAITERDLTRAIKGWMDAGHTANINTAREATATLSEKCI